MDYISQIVTSLLVWTALWNLGSAYRVSGCALNSSSVHGHLNELVHTRAVTILYLYYSESECVIVKTSTNTSRMVEVPGWLRFQVICSHQIAQIVKSNSHVSLGQELLIPRRMHGIAGLA